MIRIAISLLFGLFLAQSAHAQAAPDIAVPVAAASFSVATEFYDPRYPPAWDPPAQHLGLDIPAPAGSAVLSPVTGKVIINKTKRGDPFREYLVIRSDHGGNEHVLGHIASDLRPGTRVALGDPVGVVVVAGTGPHVHWGVNALSVGGAIDVATGWGFGRAPVQSTSADAQQRGWLDPLALVAGAKEPGITRDRWRPEVLASDARALQVRLNDLGFRAGLPDGYPGPQTRTALMLFQVKHCMNPTGQPSAETALALASATRGNFPCADAGLPTGISANTPLATGIYVSDPAYCGPSGFSLDRAADIMRMVRGRNITFGYHGHCETRRTDIKDGITSYKGQCAEGPEPFELSWRFNVLSSTRFIEISGFYQGPGGIVFQKCPDDSKLRGEWAAWFK